MKLIALALIFALQTTGLWDNTSSKARNVLLDKAQGAPVETTAITPFVPVALPIQMGSTELNLKSTAALAIDRDSGTVLYSKNIDTTRPIASVTKMVTALVILQSHTPDEIITVPELPKYPSDAEIIGLVPGDSFRLDSLLEALLVPSANDAADALAISDSGSTAAFAEKMNAYLAEWEIDGAKFSNPSGLQDTGNYASASALGKIAGLTLANPLITETVSHTNAKIISGAGRTYTFDSTNDLLASGRFYGIKTGYTAAAGQCFVGLTRINGHEVITVVLDADNRFGATVTLTNWIRANWQWI